MNTTIDSRPVVKPEPVRQLRPCDQCCGTGCQPTEDFDLEPCPCCGGGGVVSTEAAA